jgi:hypothetical protein
MDQNEQVQRIPFRLIIPVTCLVLLITGSFLSVDWINALQPASYLYPAFVKPVVSALCAALAFISYRTRLSKLDFWLLASAFACILVVDTCMSIYVYAQPGSLTDIAFLIGAALSIVAHILLVIRHARGFGFLQTDLKGKNQSAARSLLFSLWFFLPVLGIFIALSPSLMKVNQFWPSLIYALIITTSVWIAWEVYRRKMFPRINAILIAGGVTSWFITELVGVIHNIQIGQISDIAVPMTWHFYMPAILLLALSGFRWHEELT